mmetsp:Transcript_34448/g.33648  ORF Transcript_34448/g.33648 Transcript_34448/m.33648 type:complete len:116 (+) Transcript_34448:1339-1686(+)
MEKYLNEFSIIDKNDIFDSQILFSSEVKKRQRYLPIFERRKMYLLMNKTLVFQRIDQNYFEIEERIQIDSDTEIEELVDQVNRFQITSIKQNIYKVIESECKESWLAVLECIKSN